MSWNISLGGTKAEVLKGLAEKRLNPEAPDHAQFEAAKALIVGEVEAVEDSRPSVNVSAYGHVGGPESARQLSISINS